MLQYAVSFPCPCVPALPCRILQTWRYKPSPPLPSSTAPPRPRAFPAPPSIKIALQRTTRRGLQQPTHHTHHCELLVNMHHLLFIQTQSTSLPPCSSTHIWILLVPSCTPMWPASLRGLFLCSILFKAGSETETEKTRHLDQSNGCAAHGAHIAT